MTTGKELTITSFEDINSLAEAFVKSGMFSDVKSQAQAIVKIVAGSELGLPPVYSMQNINLIRDRLTTSANTMAMLVKRSGKYNYRIGSHTDTECKIEFFEGGKTVGWSTFTMDDAKRANLLKPDSGWVKYPRAMLFSRAISQGARIYAPDAIGGIYTEEEMRSIPSVLEEVEAHSLPLNTQISQQDEQQTGDKLKEVEPSKFANIGELLSACDKIKTAEFPKGVSRVVAMNIWRIKESELPNLNLSEAWQQVQDHVKMTSKLKELQEAK